MDLRWVVKDVSGTWRFFAGWGQGSISPRCRDRENWIPGDPVRPATTGKRGGFPPSCSRGCSPFFQHIVTFITFCSGSNYMHDIVSSKKMENGIVVFWEEKGEKTYESFNYSELIDMNINALDLLERPKSYKVDKDAHKLIVKK
jgi:hypothetical protein